MSASAVDGSGGAVDRPSNAPEACVGPASEQAGKASACEGCPNQAACASGAGKQVDPAIAQVQERMREVKHKILVLSGKGGVGKSTVSAQLAWTLASQGYSVGLLDIDICGPSAPRMLGVEGHEVRKSNFGWSPVYASENLAVMSVAFMLQGRNDAVIWRGPRKNGLIKQFLTDVEWGPLDFLVVDAPPGTSDEHISICQYLTACGVDGAVIVTTPQEMSLLDVRKEISFTAKVGVRVLGVVENMAGFACPSCKTTSDIFPAVTGGARAMSAEMKVPFLGSLPIDPLLLQSCEEGKCYVETHPTAPAVQPLLKLVDTLLDASPQLKQTKQERLAEANVNMADSAAPAASAAAAPAAPAASATVLASSWLSVWNAKDAAGLSGLFAPSGTFLSPMGQTSVGRAAIAAGFVKMFAGPLLHDGLHPASEVEEQSLEANTAIVRVTLQRKRKAEAPALSEAELAAGPTPPTVMTLVAQRDAQSSIGWSIVAAIGVSKVAPPPQK